MKRRTFLMGVPGLAGCLGRNRRRLNVYNWSEYVAPDTIPKFEREFNVQVRYGTFETIEEMLAKVATGNCGWDVVICTNYYIQPMAEAGLLSGLDHRELPNLGNLLTTFQRPPWDPDLRWCVPYLISTTGIAYSESVAPPPEDWSDLWSDRFHRRTTMLDDPNEVIGACLLHLGYPLNSCEPEHLRRARDAAIELKGLIRGYINSEVKDQVIAGDILVAQMWATTAQLAIDANPAIRFAYPREGFARSCDNAVILRESGRVSLAHSFINYLLRADTGLGIVAAMRSPTPNGAAIERLPDAIRNSPVLYPPEPVLARAHWLETLPPQGQRLRDRIWTEIKAS